MEVFPDCATLQCTRERLDGQSKNKATGRLYERLFIRHWDTPSEGTRSHLFTTALSAAGTAGAPLDVSRGFDADIPGKPFGDDADYAFSPDGRRLVFGARIAGKSEPWSTNFDLFESAADASAAPVNLTASNPAWDAQPRFLADGTLVWLAQQRPGFEADRFHVVVKDARGGAVRALNGGWDRSVAHLNATPDGRTLLVTADEAGQRALFALDARTGARAQALRRRGGRGHGGHAATASSSRARIWADRPISTACRSRAGAPSD